MFAGLRNFWTNLRQFGKPQLPSSVNKEDSERELLSTLPFAEVEPRDVLPEVIQNSYGLRRCLGSIIAMKNRVLMPPTLTKRIERITWTCVRLIRYPKPFYYLAIELVLWESSYHD
jgi:hypothetical protein